MNESHVTKLAGQVAQILRSKAQARVKIESGKSDHCILHIETANGQKYVAVVIQADRPVGISTVQALYELVKQTNTTRGFLFTDGIFEVEAANWAQGKPLDLIDGNSLNRLGRTHAKQKGSQKSGELVKVLVGIGTAWSIIYPILFVAALFLMMRGGVLFGDAVNPSSFTTFFSAFISIHFLTAILCLVLIVFYLIHIIKNTRASEVARILLGVSLFFMPYVAMPIYYYLYFWRATPPKWAVAQNLDQDPAKQNRSNKLVVGVIALTFITVIALPLVFMISTFLTISQAFKEPPVPVYTNLPTYGQGELPFYQASESTAFTLINTFKDIFLWSNDKDLPIVIIGDKAFLAGYINEAGERRINVDLISADVATGRVNWQAEAGSNSIAADAGRVYAQVPKQAGDAVGIIAYNIHTGAAIWQTTLDYQYAIGIDYLAITEPNLSVKTYHRNNGAFYAILPTTGKIQTSINKPDPVFMIDPGCTYEWYGNAVVVTGQNGWTTRTGPGDYLERGDTMPVVWDNLILVRPMNYTASPIIALNKKDGSIVWQSNQPVVSNIVVDGNVTFVLTSVAQLVALNTQTGEIVATLDFAPRFGQEYDFANNSLIVAANEGTVGVYFRDKSQLSFFHFNPSTAKVGGQHGYSHN